MIMTDFNAAIENLVTAIADDMRLWTARAEYGDMERAEKFASELTLNVGRKYVKITSDEVCEYDQSTRSSVWGFVVREDDNKFKKGDILLAAGYNQPARNKPRGNIFEGYPNISWTGPGYL